MNSVYGIIPEKCLNEYLAKGWKIEHVDIFTKARFSTKPIKVYVMKPQP